MTRIRFSFARKIALAYISHLDMLRLFLRALSRSGLPIAYSQGFNPHPRFSLALPLPLGVTAGKEFGELFLTDSILPGQFLNSLKAQLPEAIELTSASAIDLAEPSLASQVGAALYRAALKSDHQNTITPEQLQAALDRLMAKEEIVFQRKPKKHKISYINVRPYILEAAVKKIENEPLELKLLLLAGSQGGIAPVFLLDQLESEAGAGSFQAHNWQIHRECLYINQNGIQQPLAERM